MRPPGRPFEKCDQIKCTSTSWVTSNQKVLTYDCDLTWIIDLDFGESFSPIPEIRVTFQYAKYNTEYDRSSLFNTWLAYWWWFHNSDINFAIWYRCWFTTSLYIYFLIYDVYICFFVIFFRVYRESEYKFSQLPAEWHCRMCRQLLGTMRESDIFITIMCLM